MPRLNHGRGSWCILLLVIWPTFPNRPVMATTQSSVPMLVFPPASQKQLGAVLRGEYVLSLFWTEVDHSCVSVHRAHPAKTGK